MPTGFQQVEQTQDVDPSVEDGICDRPRHGTLGSVVADYVKPLALEQSQ